MEAYDSTKAAAAPNPTAAEGYKIRIWRTNNTIIENVSIKAHTIGT